MSKGSVTPIILYVLICLLFSIICYAIKGFLKIPVATSLLILGFALREVGPYIPQVDDAVDQAINFDPYIVSFVCLPILIFASSLTIDYYLFKKEVWQITALGTTVVVGCSVLTALALKYIFQYDYSFNDLCLLGVILSATDHITVDALLKDLVASNEFESLLGGETMFNDATVFVLFEVLKSRYSGVEGVKQTAILFTRLTLGGFGMGIAFGIAMTLIFKRAYNNFYIETNLVLIAAYLLFWICEYETVRFS